MDSAIHCPHYLHKGQKYNLGNLRKRNDSFFPCISIHSNISTLICSTYFVININVLVSVLRELEVGQGHYTTFQGITCAKICYRQQNSPGKYDSIIGEFKASFSFLSSKNA